jgi:hypothetical protein
MRLSARYKIPCSPDASRASVEKSRRVAETARRGASACAKAGQLCAAARCPIRGSKIDPVNPRLRQHHIDGLELTVGIDCGLHIVADDSGVLAAIEISKA